MQLTCQQIESVFIVQLPKGALDAATSKDFRAAVEPLLEGKTRVVLDFQEVSFVDSAGLGVLLTLLRRLAQQQGDLKVCGLSKGVKTLFQLVRMNRIVESFETVEEAVRAFACH